MSSEILERELVKLEERKEMLKSKISSLNVRIESVEAKLENERNCVKELTSKRESLIAKRDSIEKGELQEVKRRSTEIKRKLSVGDDQAGDTKHLSENSMPQREKFSENSAETFINNSDRLVKSEQFDSKRSENHSERKIQSLPAAITPLSRAITSKRLSEDIPINILKICTSYAYCKACNEAMKDAKLLTDSSHLILPSHEYCELVTKIPDSPETSLNAREESKKRMRELLSKHSLVENEQIPEKNNVLPFYSCPSVNMCRECSQLYHANEKAAAHLPLCLSVDLCNTCASSRKATEIDAKSSFDTILSDVSCFSYNYCEECRKVREMKLKENNQSAAKEHNIPNSVKQQQCDVECNKSRLSSTRPITVHPTRRSSTAKKTQSSLNLEQTESEESAQTRKKSIKESLKACQSQDTCEVCYQRLSQYINQEDAIDSVTETQKNRLSTIHDKLSLVLKRCESHAFCKSCAKLVLLKDITESNASFEHPIETYPSYNDCQNCQKIINAHPIETCTSFGECRNCRHVIKNASRRSSLLESTKRLSLRRDSDGKIVNIVPSKSTINGTDTAQQRHTNSTVTLTEPKQLQKKPSILRTCPSFGVCQMCTDYLNELVQPSKSFVVANCFSHETCKKCAQILSKKNSADNDEPSKLLSINTQSQSRKSSSPTKNVSKFIKKSSVDEKEDASLVKKPSSMNHTKKSGMIKKVSSDSSGQSLYNTVKRNIENQNNVVSDIKLKISQLANIKNADESLIDLREKLDAEKEKLREMLQVATYEQRLRKDEHWRPITVSLVDDFH